MATVYGYARVSSRDQNLNRQLDALGAYGVGSANIYADHASGKDFDRPRYRELLHVLGDGDVLVVLSIDRLGVVITPRFLRNGDALPRSSGLPLWCWTCHCLTRALGPAARRM